MRVIVCPDSFKESLTAAAAADAMARGVGDGCADAFVDCCPIADGGEGTVAALLAAVEGAERRESEVCGPLGPSQRVKAPWAVLPAGGERPRTAVLEMAAAAGLTLVPATRRDPTRTTTFGVGELILAALAAGVEQIILGIGGSGTCDGGSGMAQALGVRFARRDGGLSTPGLCGGDLQELSGVDITAVDPRLAHTRIRVACDVTNPLTGCEGAAAVYAPQKGASAAQVDELERGLNHLAKLVRQSQGDDDAAVPGAGAAGGLGFGLLAFAGAELSSGIQLVLETVRFDERIRGADLCLTGEGSLDAQTAHGKAIAGVAHAARAAGVPCYALVGRVEPGAERLAAIGLTGHRVIGPGPPAVQSMQRAAELLRRTAAELIRERMSQAAS